MGFSGLQVTEPLQGGILLFTTKLQGIPGSHLINLGKVKDRVNLGATNWFWTRYPLDWESSAKTNQLYLPRTNQETWMQILPYKAKDEKTSCKSMWIKHPWNIVHVPYKELTETLFPVESTNNIKIKITHRRVIGDGCIWERISLMNACWVIQCSSGFKCSQWCA